MRIKDVLNKKMIFNRGTAQDELIENNNHNKDKLIISAIKEIKEGICCILGTRAYD